MWTPCARRNTPSPQERRKLPSRSNTTIGCWPRLNAYTRSCLSTPTAATSALNSRPGGSFAQLSTTSYRYAPEHRMTAIARSPSVAVTCGDYRLVARPGSPPPEKRLRVRELRTRRIGLAAQCHQLLEVPRRLLTVAGGFGGARGTGEAAVAIRGLLERGLELAERRRGLTALEQHVAE